MVNEVKDTCFYSNPLYPIIVSNAAGDIKKISAPENMSQKPLKYLERRAKKAKFI
jgi:hypothetical protein